MGLRPGHCYRDLDKNRAYTRVSNKVPRKNYIGAAPAVRTRQWNMGDGVRAFTHVLNLVVDEPVVIRDNAIEASRLVVNRYLVKHAGKEGFFMKIRAFPHHIIRENKQATGAGADRMSKGMSLSFGTAIGRAVRAKQGQILISVLVMEQHIPVAQKALLRARAKLPAKIHVTVGTDVASIGTRPRKTKLQMAEEAEAAETAKATEAKGEKAAEAGKEAAPKKVSEKTKEKSKIAAEKAAEERAEAE